MIGRQHLVGLLALAAVACGPSAGSRATTSPTGGAGAGEPAEAGADLPALAKVPDGPAPEQLVALFESLADAVAQLGPDCARFAALLSRWIDRHAAGYDELAARAATEARPPEIMEALDQRLADSFEVILSGAAACDGDERAKGAFDAFEAMVEGE